MVRSLVALGSNLGSRQSLLDEAVGRISKLRGVDLLATSRWYETAAVGGPIDQPAFLNGALLLESALAPQALLAELQAIERAAGRDRTVHWGPRSLDLDLLLCGDAVVRNPELTLPHPWLALRRFVLEPAAEIAADMRHPLLGWTIGQMLAHLDAPPHYVALAGPLGVGKTALARRLAERPGVEMLAEQFDTERLGRFYADPASRAWETELEFLDHRAAALAVEAPRWQSATWTVSDFWFDHSIAFAEAWLPPDQLQRFRARFDQARLAVVRPKLLVLLDAPPATLQARIVTRGRPYEQHLPVARLEAIRRAIVARSEMPGQGPVLALTSDDLDRVVGQVWAALDAMRPGV